MKLVFLGGLHWDPRCPAAARGSLARVKAVDMSAPAFVAVEWDDAVAPKLSTERSDFQKRWKAKRPADAEQLVRQLSDTLAWEADIHADSYPDTPVIYLDNGREPLPSSTLSAVGLIYRYSMWLMPQWVEVASEEILERLVGKSVEDAEVAMQAAGKDGLRPDSDRDVEWDKAISNALPQLHGDWGLIVVGAAHASDYDDKTLFSLLSKKHECTAEFLVWKP